ncbi:MAG: hypothetical protein QM710_09335 [Flavobacterium sp.]
MDVFAFFIGICLLFLLLYFISRKNTAYSKKRANEFDEKVIRIMDKPCSVKRLKEIDVIDKRYLFQKCNLFVGDKFVALQGIDDLLFRQVLVNVMFVEGSFDPKYFKWDIVKPHLVELSENGNQIKIVFKPNATLGSSEYSLIISDLSLKEFEELRKIASYC